MRTALLTALTVLAFSVPAFADDTISLPPAGTTIISLSAIERQQMTQDTLNANLRMEQEGTSARDIQDKINKAMASAVALAKAVPEVKTSTGGYYVYQYDDNVTDPKTNVVTKTTKKWRGSQTITMESKDPTKLLELTGKIQDMGFVVGGLDYSLSVEKSDAIHDDLMAKALKSIGAKAKIAQTALGKGNYEIIDVNVDGGQPPSYPMYKSMAMASDGAAPRAMAAPTAEAGETEVSVTVTARVLLKP